MFSGESGINYADLSSLDNFAVPIGVEPALDGVERNSSVVATLNNLNRARELQEGPNSLRIHAEGGQSSEPKHTSGRMMTTDTSFTQNPNQASACLNRFDTRNQQHRSPTASDQSTYPGTNHLPLQLKPTMRPARDNELENRASNDHRENT